MSTMLTKMTFPDVHPRWATDAGVVLEPGAGEKDTGFPAEDTVPAKWLNWLHNLAYQWSLVAGMGVISNWSETHDFGTQTLAAIVHHPDNGYWLITDLNNSYVWRSRDGLPTWSNVHTLASAPWTRAIGIDTTRFLVGTNNGDIEHAVTDASTWLTETSATIGGSGELRAIETKYPASNFLMVARGTSTHIRIAASGIGGGWVAPTTNITGSDGVRRIVYASGSTWFALTDGTSEQVWKSTDDGDNWAAVSGSISTIFSEAQHMAYNPATGTLVVVGEKSGTTREIAYSADMGDNWSTATIDAIGVIEAAGNFECVYYCGGDIWIAAGDAGTGLFISNDDARTWRTADIPNPSDSVFHAASDGRKLLGTGSGGKVISSLALLGAQI